MARYGPPWPAMARVPTTMAFEVIFSAPLQHTHDVMPLTHVRRTCFRQNIFNDIDNRNRGSQQHGNSVHDCY